ncbi:TonB-dependent receptor [Shewanella sp. KX20019]|uniref:TonB-dependent receptor n=1 Tax=Shewanella sp. KX20019 TaxID=2803864 RepID=UPI001929179A|nr:TonB-dependent receptor [Shewanella sp. KX20019]QQX79785.1 TonB-dependent receptor [Shewanella sp. KX20019]
MVSVSQPYRHNESYPVSVDAVTYHNVQVRYQMDDSIALTGGVDNLFDKDAPYHQSYTDGKT